MRRKNLEEKRDACFYLEPNEKMDQERKRAHLRVVRANTISSLDHQSSIRRIELIQGLFVHALFRRRLSVR